MCHLLSNKKSWSSRKSLDLGLGLEQQDLGLDLGLGLDKKVLVTALGLAAIEVGLSQIELIRYR